MNYDVTVVTVVYELGKSGRMNMFRQCADSVAKQEGVRVEHIIVDGGSKDGTKELVAAFAKGRNDVSWMSEPDNGIYDAMNKGLRLARGLPMRQSSSRMMRRSAQEKGALAAKRQLRLCRRCRLSPASLTETPSLSRRASRATVSRSSNLAAPPTAATSLTASANCSVPTAAYCSWSQLE